jgi:hypothetical protein
MAFPFKYKIKRDDTRKIYEYQKAHDTVVKIPIEYKLGFCSSLKEFCFAANCLSSELVFGSYFSFFMSLMIANEHYTF